VTSLLRFIGYIWLLTLFSATGALAQDLQFAQLGDFKLESGDVIRDCRIGYRTFGRLNDRASNAVLFTTWASGTTQQLASNFGPGRLVDSSKYYVIAIDALGNGVSSSPSNSKLQPRMAFPQFTIKDMVNSEHEVLTHALHINHLKAVIGISMGGMQTFQWMVGYPDFIDLAIPIVGSPRLAPYDLLMWQTQLDVIMKDPDWKGGNYSDNPARVADAEFGALFLTTPEEYNKRTTRKQVFEELEKAKRTTGFDTNDKIRQTQAMMAQDVSAPFAGSTDRAAAAVKARVLIIVSRADRVVTPGPALEFAQLLGAMTLVLEGDCGHQAPGCQSQIVNRAVADFLDQ
jgi:homoserine O-acetyltransferase